jgi:hypothetical protein
VYAVPGDGGAAFRYSAVKPVWSAVKGGWYNGNDRAVCRFTYSSGGIYLGKRIMDVYNYNIADAVFQIPPDVAGRTLVFSKTTEGEGSVTLGEGVYEVRMRGGKGGEGGEGYSKRIGTGNPVGIYITGGDGSAGIGGGMLNGFFNIAAGSRIVYVDVGGTGGTGGTGSSSSYGSSGHAGYGSGISGSAKCPVRTTNGTAGSVGDRDAHSYPDDGGTTYAYGGGGGGGGGSSGISESLVISGGRAPAGDGGAVEIYKVGV